MPPILASVRPRRLENQPFAPSTSAITPTSQSAPGSTQKVRYPSCIAPDLDAASISTRLATALTGSSLVGPILVGLDKPVAALPQGCDIDEMVNLTAFVAIRGGVELTLGVAALVMCYGSAEAPDGDSNGDGLEAPGVSWLVMGGRTTVILPGRFE